jgi:predicted kinase
VLASRLALPLVTKDDIKEAFGGAAGAADLAESRTLGRAAFAAMRAIANRSLAAGAGLILEANFHRDRSEAWLRELLTHGEGRLVLCRAAPEIVRARFAERMSAGDRHPVHLDAQILADEWPDPAEFDLDLGIPSLSVDTTDGYTPDLASIVRFIQ